MKRRARGGHRVWAVVTLAMAGLAVASGCGGGGTDTGASGPDGGGNEKPRVALVMKSLANEFFKTMADGAEAHQKAAPERYELISNGIKDERDLAGQVRLVEDLIAQGVDAIVIAPADSKALVAVCKRATEAGIVVVNIDNKFDEGVLEEQGVSIPFVGPDNRKGTELIGEHLATKLKAGDPVAIIEGIPTAFNGQQRRLGYENAAKAHGWTIVDTQSGQWEINEANRVAAAILREHPEVKGLLCCNDSMALGAVAAVKDAGRTGQVLVTGYDGISAVRSAIEAGQVEASADQFGDQLAVYGIEYALQLVKDPGSVPADKDTPVEVITAASLAAGSPAAAREP